MKNKKFLISLILFLILLFLITPVFSCPKIESWIEINQIPDYLRKKEFNMIHITTVIEKPLRFKYIPIQAFYFVNSKNPKDVLIFYLSGMITKENEFIFTDKILYEIRWFGPNNEKLFWGNMCLMSNFDVQAKGE